MKDKRRFKLFLEDIIQSIEKIEEYISGLSYKDFVERGLIIDAVVRNLEIIGEASKRIPINIRESYSEIPWRRMIGLRNIVTHEYFGIDLNIIWTIVTVNLPETKPMIEAILKAVKDQN
jgi:hypothetical protein